MRSGGVSEKLCEAQNSTRQSVLNLIKKTTDIYHRNYKSDEWDRWIGTETDIAVTGISFRDPTVYLRNKEDIYLAFAEVFPANAANQNVTYTSSDPSILSVPQNGGFCSINGSGSVTVTATSEDGGYTAVQNIEVKVVNALVDQGRCGESVDWYFYSNGGVVICGTGATKDYGNDFYGYAGNNYNPWASMNHDLAGKITEVKMGEGITTVGNGLFRM